MKDDRLLWWWLDNKYPAFQQYMRAWTASINRQPEDHSEERVRTSRTVSYIDSIDSGFIKQYLLIKYQMEFVEFITGKYWSDQLGGKTNG